MLKLHGMVIAPLHQAGVRGFVVRTHSGVKIATYYGDDSFDRALACVQHRQSRS